MLKKVQLTAAADNGAGSDHPGWICTYYVYDDLGRLRCVIQPNAVNDWTLSTIELDEFCFRYEYDHRGRMITKKVPGAAPVYMIYDPWDRLLLTQDGVQRANYQYLVYKYDVLNRPVVTGVYTYFGTIDQARQVAQTYAPYQYEELLSAPSGGNGYTSRCWPEINYVTLTETYYDGYNNLPVNLSASLVNSGYGNYIHTSYNTAPLYAQPLVASSAANGMVTMTRVKVMDGSGNMLSSVNIYDEKGRIIQVQSINQTGGVDVMTNQYDFSGKLLVSHSMQQKTGTTPLTVHVATRNNYDAQGRPITMEKNLDNTGWKLLSELAYDEQGQLKTKKLGMKPDASGPLETLTYDYNIRGWMLGMNRDFIIGTNSLPHFGFELAYDKKVSVTGSGIYDKEQYNGNIAGTIWRSAGDGEKRKYDFDYDAANRLMKAGFTQHGTVGWDPNGFVNFSVKMGDGIDPYLAYDANGNILRMQQWGLKLGGSDQIDDLRYTYENNGASNKLKNVIDFKDDMDTKLGDFRTLASHPQKTAKAIYVGQGTGDINTIVDYTYDANGNLKKDLNKDIKDDNLDAIEYNHLNLPKKVRMKNKGVIEYIYDAGGNKLKKIVTDNSVPGKTVTTTTTYIGTAIYESRQTSPADAGDYTDKLLFIGHEEGRIRFEKATTSTCPAQPDRFVFDYFVKDHLGNVRMVLTEQKENICYMPATVESSRLAVEKQVYDIQNGQVIDKASTNASSISSFENNIYRTHGGLNEKTGLGIVLKVMSGDEVRISVESFYTMPSGGTSTSNMTIADLLNAFVSSNGIMSSKGTTSASTVAGSGTNTDDLNDIINQPVPGDQAKAYLNWILFDDQLRYVTSKADPVASGTGDLYKLHDVFSDNPVQVNKNGFLYIYVSNESNLPVFFDNLAVTHTPGPLLEETHYYPFGLIMGGISSKAAGGQTNKHKFNGKEIQIQEFSDGSELGTYDFGVRNYDPQIGRWHNHDPLSGERLSLTTYNAMSNNPINRVDPTGALDEWVQTPDGEMLWDDRVIDNATAREYYGQGAVHRDPGYSYCSASNDEVVLGENRQFSANGVYRLALNSTPQFTYTPGTFTYWYQSRMGEYDTQIEAYRAWQSYSGSHEGEGKWDRIMRLAASGSMEARRDYASGGMNMYGGAGNLARTVGLAQKAAAAESSVSGMTTVGRWMSQVEYNLMQSTGRMVEGAGGQTFVATGGPNAFTAAVKGSVYAEFQVPTNSLLQGGQANWFKVIGPNSGNAMQTMLQNQGGQMLPQIQNLSPILRIK